MVADSVPVKKKAAIVTNNLVCEMNAKYYSTLEKYLLMNDWVITTDFSSADKVIFSTCGFSDDMHEVIKKALAELEKNDFPEKNIIIMGCQLKTHEPELNEAFHGGRIEFGNEHLLDEMLNVKIPFKEIKNTNVFKAPGEETTADRKEQLFNIQIADGCLKQCTFCVINKAHGDIRSVPPETITEQFKTAVSLGYRNINLIAIDTLSYGYDTDTNVVELMEYLLKIESNVNFFLGSLHIRWLQKYWEGILALCKREVINSLHIGLQHINDEILKAMGRPINFFQMYQIICQFKKECPHLFISCDLIVGFPGETVEMFEELKDFLRKDKCFSLVNHYTYSDVTGAPAFNFKNKVSNVKKMLRWQEVNDILGERSPNIVLGKNDSIKLRRYQCVYKIQSKDGYYFCKDTYSEI
jgi:ribosomal protein S12 methylthiotransferase